MHQETTQKMAKKLTSSRKELMIALSILLAITWTAHGDKMSDFDLVVAQDGSGDFTTITDAIFAAPNFSFPRYRIKIRAGTYKENIIIGEEKQNLTLIGDGMDSTIITWGKSFSEGILTSDTATVGILADRFCAQFITFENTAGAEHDQAVALLSASSNSAYYGCRFTGFQDTLYAKNGIQFFRDCEIYGTVDFIFGDARAVFQNCKILARKPLPGQSNTMTAQGRDNANGNGGFVIHNCTLTATPDLLTSTYPVKTYLGRPWKNYSRTVIMESFLDVLIDAQGWLEWEGNPTRSNTLYYAEYNNRGPGADTYDRVNWTGYRVISNPMEAIPFTVRTFINGDTWIPSTEVPYEPDLIESPEFIFSLANQGLAKNNLVMVLSFSFFIMYSI